MAPGVAVDHKARIGQIVDGRYRLEAVIGHGASAAVFRALDLQTQTQVAVKILRSTHVNDAVGLARFRREGEVQAKLRHRNIAGLLAAGVTQRGEPYLAVELLRGQSLRHVIKQEGPIDPRRTASYAWQALSGLAAVHAAGVLHRDLKPANIMLEPSPGPVDRVVLIDFGFATFESAGQLTLKGTVVGSLTYMAPERLRGEAPDLRADLYAIGVIMFELLTGVPPFAAANDMALVQQHLHEEPPRLRDITANASAALDKIIARALQKHPDERFASASEMASAIENAAQQLA